MPEKAPKIVPPTITLWKCATRNIELWSMKSAGGTAISTPVIPPTTNVATNATAHSIGVA